jgi:hypothetical protein
MATADTTAAAAWAGDIISRDIVLSVGFD